MGDNHNDIDNVALQSLQSNEMEYSISAEDRQRREAELLGLGGPGAEAAGLIPTGAEQVSGGTNSQQIKQGKKKARDAFQRAADLLSSQSLEQLQQRLEDIENAIAANEMVGILLATGKFDRTNQTHLGMAQSAGLDTSKSDEDLNAQQKERAAELRDMKDEVQAAVEERRQPTVIVDSTRDRRELLKQAQGVEQELNQVDSATASDVGNFFQPSSSPSV